MPSSRGAPPKRTGPGLLFVMIASPNVPNGGIFCAIARPEDPVLRDVERRRATVAIRHHICDE